MDLAKRPQQKLPPPDRIIEHQGKAAIVLAVNVKALLAEAHKSNTIIELAPRVGDFLASGEAIFRLYGDTGLVDDRRLRRLVAFGPSAPSSRIRPLHSGSSSISRSRRCRKPSTIRRPPSLPSISFSACSAWLGSVISRRTDTGQFRSAAGGLSHAELGGFCAGDFQRNTAVWCGELPDRKAPARHDRESCADVAGALPPCPRRAARTARSHYREALCATGRLGACPCSRYAGARRIVRVDSTTWRRAAQVRREGGYYDPIEQGSHPRARHQEVAQDDEFIRVARRRRQAEPVRILAPWRPHKTLLQKIDAVDGVNSNAAGQVQTRTNAVSG